MAFLYVSPYSIATHTNTCILSLQLHVSLSCDQVLVSVEDQMITEHQLVAILMPYSLFVDSYQTAQCHDDVNLATTKGLISPPPPPPALLLLFRGAFKRLTIQLEVIYCCPACSKIPLCIPPHMCRLFTEKRNSRGMAVRKGLGCYGY